MLLGHKSTTSWFIAVLFATLHSTSVLAQNSQAEDPDAVETTTEEETEEEAEAPASDGRDREARMLFEAGQTAFEDGRFSNALDYFERAYELTARPELLYNVGVSAERLRMDERAVSALRQYLEEAPNVENRSSIESRIAILERSQSAPAETEADATSPGPGASPWILVGVGAAIAIAGGALVGAAMGHRNRVENSEAGSSWSEVEASAGQVAPLSGIGFATLGLGGAMVVGGLLWWGLASRSPDEEDTQVSFGFGSVAVRGSF